MNFGAVYVVQCHAKRSIPSTWYCTIHYRYQVHCFRGGKLSKDGLQTDINCRNMFSIMMMNGPIRWSLDIFLLEKISYMGKIFSITIRIIDEANGVKDFNFHKIHFCDNPSIFFLDRNENRIVIMKISSSLLSFIVVSSCWDNALGQESFPSVVENPTECVLLVGQDGNDNVDYFKYKVEAEESEQWSVEYSNSYKVVTNHAADEKYLLYQCGTDPPPTATTEEYTAIIPVPVSEVGIIYTTMIPFLELLGARTDITTYLGTTQWITSPCLKELVTGGMVREVSDPQNETHYTELDIPTDFPTAFIGQFGGVAYLENQIRISATEETTNLGVYEWLKFYSMFFNLERVANKLFTDVKNNYNCVERNAGLIVSDMKKPVVLWASYSDYCGGWDVAECPNYYCEFATACSATILHSSDRGSIESTQCGRNYMTTEEFVAFGKNADYWLYSSTNWDSVAVEYEDQLKDFVSVQNKEVFDFQKSGSSTWFEQRLAEPDVVLEDFCTVVGTERVDLPGQIHVRAYFRNVFTEDIGMLDECDDPTAPLVTQATKCIDLPPVEGEGPSTDPASTASSTLFYQFYFLVNAGLFLGTLLTIM